MHRPRMAACFSLAILGLILTPAARADYKISHSKGFARVVEIVEKTENADGTFTVKARKSRGDTEIVEYPDVVSIEEVEAGTGLAPMKAPVPTPTILIRTERALPGSGAPAAPPFPGSAVPPVPGTPSDVTQNGSGLVSEYPVLKTFMDNLTWVFIGGLVSVLFLFVVFRTKS